MGHLQYWTYRFIYSFFQIGIENLKSNGILGYITMNTFFKSLNGRLLRKYFQEKKLEFDIIDFGSSQIFASKIHTLVFV